MERYRHNETGKTATVVEENKKFKTVILEFEDKSTINVDTSTLKKQYTYIQ